MNSKCHAREYYILKSESSLMKPLICIYINCLKSAMNDILTRSHSLPLVGQLGSWISITSMSCENDGIAYPATLSLSFRVTRLDVYELIPKKSLVLKILATSSCVNSGRRDLMKPCSRLNSLMRSIITEG